MDSHVAPCKPITRLNVFLSLITVAIVLQCTAVIAQDLSRIDNVKESNIMDSIQRLGTVTTDAQGRHDRELVDGTRLFMGGASSFELREIGTQQPRLFMGRLEKGSIRLICPAPARNPYLYYMVETPSARISVPSFDRETDFIVEVKGDNPMTRVTVLCGAPWK